MSIFPVLIAVAILVCFLPLGLYVFGVIKDPFHPTIFVGVTAFIVSCLNPFRNVTSALNYVNIGSIDYYLAVVIASLLAFYIGCLWHSARLRRQSRWTLPDASTPELRVGKLLFMGGLYVVVGVSAYCLTREQWTTTGYLRDWGELWVAGLILILQVLLLTRRYLVECLILLGIALVPSVDRFIVYGQRGSTFRVALCAILIFLFRGQRPKRAVYIPALAGLVLVFAVLDRTRTLTAQMHINRIQALIQAIPSFLEEKPLLYSGQEEFIYGSAMVQAVRDSDEYNYGRFLADVGVRFLPKEYFNKERLYSPWSRATAGQTTEAETGYLFLVGSMPTGFAAVFVEFGWFGMLFWMGMGYCFQKRYSLALNPQRVDYHGYFMGTFILVLYLVTQDLTDFVMNFIYLIVPLWLAYRISIRRSSNSDLVSVADVAANLPVEQI